MFYLQDELQRNGIASYIPEFINHACVLAELDYALRPRIHEGKIQPYGFIVTPDSQSPVCQGLHEQGVFGLADARKIADGYHSFVVFQGGVFRGIFPVEQNVQDELQLVQLQQKLNATICTTDTAGVTKLFCESGILIHQYRQWQIKPSVKQVIRSVCRCVPHINVELLQSILEFCFYELSARKIGATIAWYLESISDTKHNNLFPEINIKKRIKLTIGATWSNAILRHILTYTDGATILDPEGTVMGVGVQLKYSEVSRSLIQECQGTRHTSAKRFSYDFPEVLLFVVSSDGPVTVFSDGMSIVNLEMRSTDQTLLATEPCLTPEDAALCASKSKQMTCATCRKPITVQESGLLESSPREVDCPICHHPLYTTPWSGVERYVIKPINQPLQLTNLSANG